MIAKILSKEKYIISLFWIWLYFIFWLQATPQVESVWESTLFCTILFLTICPIANYLSGILLIRAIKNKKYKLFIVQFIVASVIIGLFFIFYIFLFNYLEYKNVFPKSSYFDIRPYNFMYFVTISAGFIINITICGLRFFLEYLKTQKTLNEYRLITLQHQVTPHFMFNVLNHIHILMQSDVSLASDLLIRYSDILRYQLYKGVNENVSLEEDILFLKNFIAIEELRWEGKLTVNSNWAVNHPKKQIPSLLFIPFVENAFKYVSRSNTEKGFINIKFTQHEDFLDFQIENSKYMITKKEQGGLGLKNIKQRLDILYPNNYDLVISETDIVYSVKLIINL